MYWRPVTINTLVKFLRSIKETPSNEEELSEKLGISKSRLKEILHVAHKMELIKIHDKKIFLSPNGEIFLKAYNESKGDILHKLFMKIDEYRIVYSLYSSGTTRVKDLCKLTNFNAVIVDTILRIIRDIIVLSHGAMEGIYDSKLYDKFKKILLNEYKKLVITRHSRYIPIVLLKRNILSKLNLGEKLFIVFLERFIKENKHNIILAPAPLSRSSSNIAIKLFERNYVYIYIRGNELW